MNTRKILEALNEAGPNIAWTLDSFGEKFTGIPKGIPENDRPAPCSYHLSLPVKSIRVLGSAVPEAFRGKWQSLYVTADSSKEEIVGAVREFLVDFNLGLRIEAMVLAELANQALWFPLDSPGQGNLKERVKFASVVEVPRAVCPACGSDCYHTNDSGYPGASGWRYWSCNDREGCGWNEVSGTSRKGHN